MMMMDCISREGGYTHGCTDVHEHGYHNSLRFRNPSGGQDRSDTWVPVSHFSVTKGGRLLCRPGRSVCPWLHDWSRSRKLDGARHDARVKAGFEGKFWLLFSRLRTRSRVSQINTLESNQQRTKGFQLSRYALMSLLGCRTTWLNWRRTRRLDPSQTR